MKVCLFGGAKTGTTAIMLRLKDGTFVPNESRPFSVDFCVKNVQVDSQTSVKVRKHVASRQWRNRTGMWGQGGTVPPGGIYQACEDIEEGGRKKGRRQKKEKREKKGNLK